MQVHVHAYKGLQNWGMTSTRGRKLTVGILDFLHNQSKIRGISSDFILIYCLVDPLKKGGGYSLINIPVYSFLVNYCKHILLSRKEEWHILLFFFCVRKYWLASQYLFLVFSLHRKRLFKVHSDYVFHLHVIVALVIDINS